LYHGIILLLYNRCEVRYTECFVYNADCYYLFVFIIITLAHRKMRYNNNNKIVTVIFYDIGVTRVTRYQILISETDFEYFDSSRSPIYSMYEPNFRFQERRIPKISLYSCAYFSFINRLTTKHELLANNTYE